MPNVFWDWAQEWEMITLALLAFGFMGSQLLTSDTTFAGPIIEDFSGKGCYGGPIVDGKCQITVNFPEDAQCVKDATHNAYTCRWNPDPPRGDAAVNRDSDPGAVRGPVVVSTDPGAIQSHCYVPGEAHNELTLPCVTIEP